MKSLFGRMHGVLLVAASLWWGGAAIAQSTRYVLATVVAGGTNTVPLATTNATAHWIDCTTAEQVGLQISFRCTGTNTQDVTFRLYQSLDRTNWYTGSAYTVAVTANGTNTVTHLTNWTVNATGWLKIYSTENPNGSSTVTNLVVMAAVKRS